MSPRLLDGLSQDMLAIKSSVGNLVELVENWILSLSKEEERRRLLEQVQAMIDRHGASWPVQDLEQCRQNLRQVIGGASQQQVASASFRQRLQQMCKDQVEKLQVHLDDYFKRVARLVVDLEVDPDQEPASPPAGKVSRRQPAKGMVMAQEEERRRIAREIHDGPAQSLASLTMRIDYCLEQIAQPEVLSTELRELKETVIRSLKDIRRFIFDLRPMAIDDLGLVPTLEQFIVGFKARTGVGVYIDITGERVHLPTDHELAIFRVVQEAVNNAARHSQGTSVHVFLNYDHEHHRLTGVVKDDGKGFEVASVRRAYPTLNKLGLISMEERIALAGGSFELVSGANQGTIVSFWVPFS
jgi:two-component system, NarL family, sensor histidine kinase DegS